VDTPTINSSSVREYVDQLLNFVDPGQLLLIMADNSVWTINVITADMTIGINGNSLLINTTPEDVTAYLITAIKM
jgi:hypothetical protein